MNKCEGCQYHLPAQAFNLSTEGIQSLRTSCRPSEIEIQQILTNGVCMTKKPENMKLQPATGEGCERFHPKEF